MALSSYYLEQKNYNKILEYCNILREGNLYNNHSSTAHTIDESLRFAYSNLHNYPKSIELGEIRYENKAYNKAVIEIKNNDDIKYIFELDDNLNKSELEINKNYYRESIYIIQYDDNNNILLSYGVIIDIFKKQIKYLSNIKPNIKDNIILNLNNNKIIGVNDSNKGKNGMLFNDLIYKFIYKINHKLMSNRFQENISRIKITVHIKKNEINKEIYFLDNYYYDDDGNKKYTHDHLNELDEHNTKLFINGKLEKYKKYFKSEKAIEYNIELILDKYSKV
jgi:hypothetical protein